MHFTPERPHKTVTSNEGSRYAALYVQLANLATIGLIASEHADTIRETMRQLWPRVPTADRYEIELYMEDRVICPERKP
jgi:uncharacterized protein HemY